MDYKTLRTEILANTDTFFTGQIPNFINQAINRIYSETNRVEIIAEIELALIAEATEAVSRFHKKLSEKQREEVRKLIEKYNYGINQNDEPT